MGLVVVLAAAIASFGAAASEQHGSWTVQKDKDPFTDEATIFAYVEVDQAFMPPALVVLCATNDLAIRGVGVVVNGVQYSLRDSVEVTYRVDSKPSVTATWSANAQAVLPFFEETERFLDELVGGQRLILRVAGSASSPIYEFKVDGFADAMRALGCYTGPL